MIENSFVCPKGIDAGREEDMPFSDSEDTATCAGFIDDAKQFVTITDDCAAAEEAKNTCCYTEPVKPCTLCPAGTTVNFDKIPDYIWNPNELTCSDLDDSFKYLETESSYCGVYSPIERGLCCLPDSQQRAGDNGKAPAVSSFAMAISAFAVISFTALAALYIIRKRASNAKGASPATDPEGVFQMPGGGNPTAVAMRMDPEASGSKANPEVTPSYARHGPNPYAQHATSPPLS